MEVDKLEHLNVLIDGLVDLEDTALALANSRDDGDSYITMLQTQWEMDHAVKQAFKLLRPKLTACITALKSLIEFEKNNPQVTDSVD